MDSAASDGNSSGAGLSTKQNLELSPNSSSNSDSYSTASNLTGPLHVAMVVRLHIIGDDI